MPVVSGIMVLAFLVGWGAVSRLSVKMCRADRILWALPLGLEILSLTAFLLSWALGTVGLALAATGIAALGFAGFTLVSPVSRGKLLPKDDPWRPSDLVPYLAVLVPWVVFTAAAYPGMLVWRDGGLVSGWANAWADWSAHLRSSTFLATQNPFTLENSLLSGVPARYPLLEAFQTSVFQRLGLEPVTSLLWSGFPFFALFPVLVLSFLRGLGLRPWFAVLGTVLFVFSGGFGVFSLVQDLAAGVPYTVDPYHPRLYTDMKDATGNRSLGSIWFMNFVVSEFVPQRAFLFGLPWALLTFLGFWQNFALRPTRRQKVIQALGLGCAWGALLLFHTHSALALGLVFFLGAVVGLGRELLGKNRVRGVPGSVLGASALGLGTLVFYIFLLDPGKAGGMVHFLAGWVPGPGDLPSVLLFLLRNFGVVLVSGLAVFFVRDFRTRLLAAGALAILVVANLVAFQPWIWDNMKLLTWWYLMAAAATVYGAQHVWGRLKSRVLRRSAVALVAAFLVLATGAGLWDVTFMGASASRPQLGLAAPDGVAFAEEVRAYFRAHPDESRSVVAIAPEHNHPVSLLGGTRIYLGYTGWLWSYGLPYQDRADLQKTIFSGGPEALSAARRAGIGFVVSGPPERQEYGPPRAPLDQSFVPVLRSGPWNFLKVP